ncbi:MAG: oligosaccharide flippase family protein [Candidatus Brocadiaceae bacterium]|nr:oligosaccharide flippase family protein [Candidatus Brocadiaceae bacterium]
MASKEKQIKNSLIYLLPVFIGNLIPLATLSIFTRILTKEDYGVLGLAQVYAIFASGLANFGLTVGYERNFFQYVELKKSSDLLYSTLAFVISGFLVVVVLTYLFKSHLAKWIIGSSVHSDILFWALCSTGIMGLKNYYLIYFKNTENAKSFAWYTIDESILGVVMSLFLVVYLRTGIIGLVCGQLFASLTIFLILGFNFLKIYPVRFNWGILKESLKLSYPLTPKIFLGVIGNQFDKYMIGLLTTVGGVGIYSIGQKVAGVVFTFMGAIQNVYSPQVYKRMFNLGQKGGESVGRYMTPFAYISMAVALIISLFSEEVISLLTPKSYHGAIDIVIVLSMFYGSWFFGKQPQLIYAKKTHISSLLSVVIIVLNVLINIPFIMKWGAIGAAWGTFLAGLISGGIAFWVSQHYYEIKWEYKKIGAIYLIFFCSSILMLLLRNAHVGYEIRVIAKCICLASYLYLGVKLGIISMENYFVIKQMLPIQRIIFFQRK